MLALVLNDAEMNNLLVVAALRPIAGCQPHDFTVPAEALAFAWISTAYSRTPDFVALDVKVTLPAASRFRSRSLYNGIEERRSIIHNLPRRRGCRFGPRDEYDRF